MDDYYDEGSDIDNWENEQVFQDHAAQNVNDAIEAESRRLAIQGAFDSDHEGDEFSDEDLSAVDDAESLFRDAYETAFGSRPAFSVGHLSNTELLFRIENLQAADAANRFLQR